jgi:hypothetical protein
LLSFWQGTSQGDIRGQSLLIYTCLQAYSMQARSTANIKIRPEIQNLQMFETDPESYKSPAIYFISITVFVTRVRHFGAQFDHILCRQSRINIYFCKTRGPQNYSPEVTETVMNIIILNVWIENGPVYGPGI